MGTLTVKVIATKVIKVPKEHFREDYEEACAAEGEEAETEVPDDFVLSAMRGHLVAGEVDIVELFEYDEGTITTTLEQVPTEPLVE